MTFNDVTKDASFYTTTSRFVTWFGVFSLERQVLWMSKDDLQDSSSWSSSPLLLLRDIHSKLLTQYNCKEVCAPSQSQTHVGSRGGLRSQDGVSQQQQDAPLFVPRSTVSMSLPSETPPYRFLFFNKFIGKMLYFSVK